MSLVTNLAALLDGLNVTDGTSTVAFTYLSWGKHFNLDEQPADGGVCSINRVDTPARATDTGYGAERVEPMLDCHFWWEDEEGMDLDTFRDALEAAVRDVVRSNAKSLDDTFFATVANVVDLTALRGKGSTILIPHVVATVHARQVAFF